MTVRVSLAGRVSITTDGVLIEEDRLPGRQGRLVFAYLAGEHGRAVPRDELAEALWGETPPATWEKALGVIASKLRSLFTECGLDGAKVLTSAFGCYRLELPGGSWIDVQEAARSADDAKAALMRDELDKARAKALEAVSLARLPLLPGEDAAWVEQKRREQAAVLARALGCLAEACLRSGDAAESARWAEQEIELEPFRESGYRRLMQAHAAAGDRAEALQVYERCRRLLADELGAYPSPETESIYRELLRSPATARDVDALPAARDGELAASPVAETTTGWRPQGRRLVIAVTLAAAAAGAAFVLVSRDFGSGESRRVGADALGVIDPEGGKVVLGIPVAAAPGDVAAGPDALWVTSPNGNTVARIDPSTNDVRQTIHVGGGPAGVAVGGGAVWVANGLEGTVSRIDPTTNQVVQTITVGNGPSGVAFGGGPSG